MNFFTIETGCRNAFHPAMQWLRNIFGRSSSADNTKPHSDTASRDKSPTIKTAPPSTALKAIPNRGFTDVAAGGIDELRAKVASITQTAPFDEKNANFLKSILNRPDRFPLPDPRWDAFIALKKDRLSECLDLVLNLMEREMTNIESGSDPSDVLLEQIADSLRNDLYKPNAGYRTRLENLHRRAMNLVTADSASISEVGNRYYPIASYKTRLTKHLDDALKRFAQLVRAEAESSNLSGSLDRIRIALRDTQIPVRAFENVVTPRGYADVAIGDDFQRLVEIIGYPDEGDVKFLRYKKRGIVCTLKDGKIDWFCFYFTEKKTGMESSTGRRTAASVEAAASAM